VSVCQKPDAGNERASDSVVDRRQQQRVEEHEHQHQPVMNGSRHAAGRAGGIMDSVRQTNINRTVHGKQEQEQERARNVESESTARNKLDDNNDGDDDDELIDKDRELVKRDLNDIHRPPPPAVINKSLPSTPPRVLQRDIKQADTLL